jgi:hypothetical protein
MPPVFETLVGKRGQIEHVRIDHVERVIIRKAAPTNATSREPEPKGLDEVIIRPRGGSRVYFGATIYSESTRNSLVPSG